MPGFKKYFNFENKIVYVKAYISQGANFPFHKIILVTDSEK